MQKQYDTDVNYLQQMVRVHYHRHWLGPLYHDDPYAEIYIYIYIYIHTHTHTQINCIQRICIRRNILFTGPCKQLFDLVAY